VQGGQEAPRRTSVTVLRCCRAVGRSCATRRTPAKAFFGSTHQRSTHPPLHPRGVAARRRQPRKRLAALPLKQRQRPARGVLAKAELRSCRCHGVHGLSLCRRHTAACTSVVDREAPLGAPPMRSGHGTPGGEEEAPCRTFAASFAATPATAPPPSPSQRESSCGTPSSAPRISQCSRPHLPQAAPLKPPNSVAQPSVERERSRPRGPWGGAVGGSSRPAEHGFQQPRGETAAYPPEAAGLPPARAWRGGGGV
jgi:hypothetical protein